MKINPDAHFVFELRADKIHLGSIIVEGNQYQYYHILFLHQRHHWHLVGEINQKGYLEKILNRGFHLVPREEYYCSRRPFFILLLDRNHDHYLPEITVVNNLNHHPYAVEILNSIPFQEIATEMMVNKYDELKADGRANNRVDIAYTP